MQPVDLVLDNGPSTFKSQERRARSSITVEWLPRYAPGLDDIEPTWRDWKRLYFGHRTFQDAEELKAAIHSVVTK